MDNLKHYGVKGMKWGIRRYQPYPRETSVGEKIDRKSGDVVLEKGTQINRLVRTEWLDREKSLKGHAYASYKKEDLERYKMFARLFGMDNKTVHMSFEAKKNLKSPSPKVRADTFLDIMKNNPDARQALEDATRRPFNYLRKKHLKNLDVPKSAEKAFNKFAYNIVSNKDLRDPYFKALRDKGYSMVMDDADISGGVSKAPIIVFDREESLELKGVSSLEGKELQHYGVKGMKWGVRRYQPYPKGQGHKGKFLGKVKKAAVEGRIGQEVRSSKRSLEMLRKSRNSDNMSTKEIRAHAERARLENQMKQLAKTSKEKKDYRNRVRMSDQEIRRKVNRLQAKDTLNKEARKGSERERELGKALSELATDVLVSQVTGNTSDGKKILNRSRFVFDSDPAFVPTATQRKIVAQVKKDIGYSSTGPKNPSKERELERRLKEKGIDYGNMIQS